MGDFTNAKGVRPDLEQKNFFGDSNDDVVKRVGWTDPQPVEFDELGEQKTQFAKQSAVAGGSSIDIVSYTVPVGKTFKLSEATFSGENIADFEVFADSNVIGEFRTYWNNFNADIRFYNQIFTAGTVLKIRVNNFRNSFADFSGAIKGREL